MTFNIATFTGTAARSVLATALLLAIAIKAGPVTAQPAAAVLDLVEIRIDEGPVDNTSARNRDVNIRFVLSQAPLCDAALDGLTYALLVDADLDPATGARLEAFPEIGIERRAVVRCNGATGQFVSRSGTVHVETAGPGGPPTLRLTIRLSRLPSPAFSWIGIASLNGRYRRAPAAGVGDWSILERALW